ncbi:MYB-like transcription factor [Quillaja saponaria]|uniref:MYB-like transcription factor n=1 Tax=Quillaja saponaria TaxID=32244 RepID=A0AAD7M0I3_QUISA|nr:MYB-like transcription factor [Quillaja saponaria]
MADSQHSSSNNTLENRQVRTRDETMLEFSDDEKLLMSRMYNLVGERWGLIAGRIPGRTAEEIGKYWTSRNSTN